MNIARIHVKLKDLLLHTNMTDHTWLNYASKALQLREIKENEPDTRKVNKKSRVINPLERNTFKIQGVLIWRYSLVFIVTSLLYFIVSRVVEFRNPPLHPDFHKESAVSFIVLTKDGLGSCSGPPSDTNQPLFSAIYKVIRRNIKRKQRKSSSTKYPIASQ